MELNQLLSQLNEFTNDSILITRSNFNDPDGPEIVYANRAFTKLTGYSNEELIGKTPRILQGPKTCRKTLHKIKTALEKQEPIVTELLNYHKDGSEYWIEISLNPISDTDSEECVYFVAVERDITERKNDEISMRYQVQKAQETTKAKSEFLANMSHELRTPMNGLLGLVDILRGTDLTEEQRECIEAINSSGETLLYILNDILDFSKIEAGELSLDPRPFDLKKNLKQVRDITAPQASKKGLNYDVHISIDTPNWLIGDEGRVQQILINLIGNAIKFTSEGKIELSVNWAKRDGVNMLLLDVADTGIGIPKDFQKELFNKFSQADTSISRRFGGTGLGLAITKSLIHMMNGTISFDSEEGKGTVFHIALPLPATEAPDTHTSTINEDEDTRETLDVKNVSVLVVEDHPINQMLVEKWLAKMGIRNVDIANNGFESLSHLRHKVYHVIFMDCQMPELDGYETTSLIRDMEKQVDRHTPIIAMTANAMVGEREKCLQAGMDDYLSKPLKFEAFQEMLFKWLRLVSSEDNPQAPEEHIRSEHDNRQDAPKNEQTPVDVSRLREFTDGDIEMERKVIGMFVTSSEESLAALNKNCRSNDAEQNETWRQAAHRLKGASGNLGAEQLYTLCAKAEELYLEDEQQKQVILEAIQGELSHLNNFLQNLH